MTSLLNFFLFIFLFFISLFTVVLFVVVYCTDCPSFFTRQAADVQSRYIELLTRSTDYYKLLTEMQKNMEDLKVSVQVMDCIFIQNCLFCD